MKKQIKRIAACWTLLILMLVGAGCAPELKTLALNQLVGVASQITSALVTGAIQSVLAG
ncbi:MAG: hypothetical protein WC975_10960 [Phycisphaerae bacterium]